MPEAVAPEAPAAPAPEAQTVTPPPKTGPVVEKKPRLYKGVDLDALFSSKGEEATEAPADGEQAETPAPVAAAPTATEPPKETPKPAEKKPEPMAKAFAELSKREAKLRAEQKAKDDEFKAREVKLAEKEAALQNLLDDPLSHLEKLGITYEVLTEQVLNGKKPPPGLKERSELQKLKAAMEAREKADREREEREKSEKARAEEQSHLDAFRATVTKTVTDAGEAYELVNALGRHDLVFDVIDAYAAKHGTLLPIEDAAAQVEAHLEAEKAEEVRRLLQTKKLSAKLPAVSPAPQRPSGGQSATSGQRTPKTLTASAAAPQSVSTTPLTDEQRRAKAIAELQAALSQPSQG